MAKDESKVKETAEQKAERRKQAKAARQQGDKPLQSVFRGAALAAQNDGDYAAALGHWAELRQHYPTAKTGYVGAIRTARAAKDEAAVAGLLAEATMRFPDHAAKFHAVADGARRDSDADGFKALLKLPPSDPAAELAAAMAPINDPQKPERKVRNKAMRERLEAVVERFPDYAPASLAQLTTLRTMGRLQTAAQLATKYSEKFPDDVAIGLAHIAILADKKDDAAALTLATALKGRAGPSADIDIAYIQALARAGRLDDAATACAAAAAAFPNNADVVCEQAELATRRGNWTGAVERWKAAAALAPNSKRIKAGLEAAQLQVAELDLPEGDDTTD